MKELQLGSFGPIYTQFEGKPKEAIKHLRKMKKGECIKALYRDDIGYLRPSTYVTQEPQTSQTGKEKGELNPPYA